MTGEELQRQLEAIEDGACAACAENPAIKEGFCASCLRIYRAFQRKGRLWRVQWVDVAEEQQEAWFTDAADSSEFFKKKLVSRLNTEVYRSPVPDWDDEPEESRGCDA